jgi:hypothetical protein
MPVPVADPRAGDRFAQCRTVGCVHRLCLFASARSRGQGSRLFRGLCTPPYRPRRVPSLRWQLKSLHGAQPALGIRTAPSPLERAAWAGATVGRKRRRRGVADRADGRRFHTQLFSLRNARKDPAPRTGCCAGRHEFPQRFLMSGN